MNTYLIALGSNLGDRKSHIEQAREAIGSECGKVLRCATILETEPLGAADQVFLNTALLCESSLEPEAMLSALLAIEVRLGRIRSQKWGNRTIDCDLILWRDQAHTYPIHRSHSLLIPHPELIRRDFVLGPAAEIAGKWIHPELKLTLEELWENFKVQG